MSEQSQSSIAAAFQETGTQLDRIIAAFRRKPVPNPTTRAYYSDGSVLKHNIVGTLSSGEIDLSNLVRVEIGDAVTEIGRRAFYVLPTAEYDSMLRSVSIPNSISVIEDEAFKNTPLTAVYIPDSVLSIGEETFCKCDDMLSAFLGRGISKMERFAFGECSNLSSIVSYSEIAEFEPGTAFGEDHTYCTGRNSYQLGTNRLYLPVGAIGYENKWGYPLLDPDQCGFTIEYDSAYGVFDRTKTVAFYSDGRKEEYDIVGTLNRGDVLSTDLTSIIVGTEVTAIGDSAFENVASLEKCYLSTSVISIGNAAFKNCSSIKDGSFNYSAQVSIGEEAFAGCNALMLSLADTMSVGTNAFATNSPTVLLAPNTAQAEVQAMSNYSWGLPVGSAIVCQDGYIMIS